MRLDYFQEDGTAEVDLRLELAAFATGISSEIVPILVLTTGGIRDVASIGNNSELVYLSLANNSIGDPNGLGTLDELVFLDLARNEISGMDGLSGTYLIDDGDWFGGYSETGATWLHNTQPVASAVDGDNRFWFDADVTDKANWSFSGLPDGEYEVYATWHEHHDHATDATFEIQHKTSTDEVKVNQRFKPDSLTLGGQDWEKLDSFSPDEGDLVVSLIGTGDGTVVADAVMLRAVDSILPALTKLKLGDNPLSNKARDLDIPEILPTNVLFDSEPSLVWTSNLNPQIPTAVTIFGNELTVTNIADQLDDPISLGKYLYQVATSDPLVTGFVSNGGTLRVLAEPAFEGVAQVTVTASRGPEFSHDSRGRSAEMTFDYVVDQHYLRGSKFADQNQNGLQDTGEAGLENWKIFLDYDDDGVQEQGMTSVQVGPAAIDAGANVFELDVEGLPSNITRLRVGLDITHPSSFTDLQNIKLTSPNGTRITLLTEVNYSSRARPTTSTATSTSRSTTWRKATCR